MLALRHGPPVRFDGDPGLGPSGWAAREHRDMTIRLRHFGYFRV
jgi:hypothetical protein